MPTSRRKLRATALIGLLCLLVSNLSAAPCVRTRTQQDSWVVRRVDALVRAARIVYEDDDDRADYERVLDGLTRTIKRCRMGDDRDFVGRYPEFFEYVRVLSLSRMDDHELGFEVSDKVYFAETSAHTAIPDFLLTRRFLRAVRRSETLPRAKALLREMNAARAADDQLLFLSYASRHLGTPDNPDSFRRLLIVVPGNAALNVPEKWVQFGVADPRARAPVRNVSVVAVMPGPEQTTNVYFKDYFRTYRRNGSINIKGRWELGYGDDNCVQCHKSGILPIFPVEGSVRGDEKSTLDAVNERFLTYGPPRFDRYLDPSKLGPGLGSPRPPRQADRGLHGGGAWTLFRHNGSAAAANTSDTPRCSSCHHSDGLGALNWPMDSTLISSFVEGGQMPRGAKLGRSERTKLYEQLIKDYFATDDAHPGILKAWLLGKSR